MALSMEMEDATQYLSHNPTGVPYLWRVYDDSRQFSHPLTGAVIRSVCFAGTRQECADYIKRNTE